MPNSFKQARLFGKQPVHWLLFMLALFFPALTLAAGSLESPPIQSTASSMVALVGDIETNLRFLFAAVAGNVLRMAQGLFFLGITIALMWQAWQIILRGHGGLEEVFAGGMGLQIVAWAFIALFIVGNPPPAAQAIASVSGGEGWVTQVAGAVGDKVRPSVGTSVPPTAEGSMQAWLLVISQLMLSWDSATVVPENWRETLSEDQREALENRGPVDSTIAWIAEYSARALIAVAAIIAILVVTIGFWHLILTVFGTQLQLLIGGSIGALMLAGAASQVTRDYADKWLTLMVSVFIKLVLIYIVLTMAVGQLNDLALRNIPMYASPIKIMMILQPALAMQLAWDFLLGTLSFAAAAYFIVTVLLMVPSVAEDLIQGSTGSNSGIGSALRKAAGPIKVPK